MDPETLLNWQHRWNTAWQALQVPAPAALLPRLLACYSEPQRRYHTLQHLDECLALFQCHASQAERPGEVALALWFHDAIYNVRKYDNEAQSAAWAQGALQEAGVPADAAERVHALIMTTCHTAPPQGRDAQLVVDIDLAILGAAPARFAEYQRQIRAEYAYVPAIMFHIRRRAFLERFLARRPLYLTEPLRTALETQARANVQSILPP